MTSKMPELAHCKVVTRKTKPAAGFQMFPFQRTDVAVVGNRNIVEKTRFVVVANDVREVLQI